MNRTEVSFWKLRSKRAYDEMISANSASRGLLVKRNKQERHQGSIVRRVDVDTLTQCGRRAQLFFKSANGQGPKATMSASECKRALSLVEREREMNGERRRRKTAD